MDNKTEKQRKSDAIERRKYLIKISNIIKETMIKKDICKNVNEGLKMLYEKKGYKNLKSFFEWSMENKRVKKGEKALMLWAKPKFPKRYNIEIKNSKGDEDFKYFPIYYVFSESQVEEIQNHIS